MNAAPKEDTARPKDVDWLREQVVTLFEASTKTDDLASSTKLAELLYKLLPKANGKAGAMGTITLDEARAAILEGQVKA